MEDELSKRKRKKKDKKHSSKTKKMKRDRGISDEDASSEGELQWVESTSLIAKKDVTRTQSSREHNTPKRDDWMTVPLSPSSGSLTELTHRKAIKEDRNEDLKVCTVTM